MNLEFYSVSSRRSSASFNPMHSNKIKKNGKRIDVGYFTHTEICENDASAFATKPAPNAFQKRCVCVRANVFYWCRTVGAQTCERNKYTEAVLVFCFIILFGLRTHECCVCVCCSTLPFDLRTSNGSRISFDRLNTSLTRGRSYEAAILCYAQSGSV